MDWITAWEQAQRDLRETSKTYDIVRSIPEQVRSSIGAAAYAQKRTAAYERYRKADQICVKLRQMKNRRGFQITSALVV